MVDKPPEIRLPILKKKQLLRRVVELEHRIYHLEEALQIIQKNKSKRERRKKDEEKKEAKRASTNKKRLQLSSETQKLAPHGRIEARPY